MTDLDLANRALTAAKWSLATAIVSILAAVVAVVLSGCTTIEHEAGNVGGTLAELVACPTDLIDCGHVYLCAAPADNPLGHVEICVDDDDHPEQLADVEDVYGACVPTPRHEGLCIYCCGDGCGRGANAYSGTWCPDDGTP
jgi:hypothetical protein